MDFGFSAEQDMLREQVQRLVRRDSPIEVVRAIAAGDAALERRLWARTAELGLHGLIVPERHGGLGLGWVDYLVVLEEAGRSLSPLPFVPQALAASAILIAGSDVQKQDWLPSLAAGERRWALGLHDESNWIAPEAVTLSGSRVRGGVVLQGAKPHVSGGAGADELLIAFRIEAGIAAARVEAARLALAAQPTMDATKANARATCDRLFVAEADIMPLDAAALGRLADLGALAVVAEAVGAAEEALRITSDYARERVQFGRPIGQYQGIKHRLADMFVDVESFKSLAYHAAWCADNDPEELPRAASLAKAYASDAFAQIGIDCVGAHGAIGYTAEYDIQLYLKRSKWARAAFGDSDFHLDRVARYGGL
jgi:alkylation response protein AidB-like acyl-CoA dehydrogenase